MTSSRTINRGVSPMTDYGRYRHTQTLSHKTHRLDTEVSTEDRRLHTEEACRVVTYAG